MTRQSETCECCVSPSAKEVPLFGDRQWGNGLALQRTKVSHYNVHVDRRRCTGHVLFNLLTGSGQAE